MKYLSYIGCSFGGSTVNTKQGGWLEFETNSETERGIKLAIRKALKREFKECYIAKCKWDSLGVIYTEIYNEDLLVAYMKHIRHFYTKVKYYNGTELTFLLSHF